MEHQIVKVVDFEVTNPYELRIVFDDNTIQTIDFEPVLQGYYYGPLQELELFEQVRIDPEIGTLVWPNGADFDPATLYHWNEGEGRELAKRLDRLAQNEASGD